MEDVTIESLIAQKKVVTTADLLNPTNDYMVVGVYQNGTNKSKGDGTSYKNYVISIAELLGGGAAYFGDGVTINLLPGNIFSLASSNISQFVNDAGYITSASIPITNTVIPQGNGSSIIDGTWQFSGNNIIPITTASNIGSPTNRIGTIFMASIFDYATNLVWSNGGTDYMKLTTSGILDVISADGNFEVGSVDAYSRRQVWVKYLNGLLRMGSDTSDGDPTDIDSEGIVVFHPSDNRAARIKADRFGLTASSDTSLYYFRADPSKLFYKDQSLNPIFWVDSTSGNVGVGINTPTARLHVKGVGDLATDFAMRVENLSAQNLYNVGGSGQHRFNSYFDGSGSGIPNYQFESDSGVLIKLKSTTSTNILWEETAGNVGSLYNAGGYMHLLAKNRFTLKNFAGTSKLWMNNTDGYIAIGDDYFGADSQLHVRGKDATSGNYGFKVQDNTGAKLLTVRNDGYISTSIPTSGTGFPPGGTASGDLWHDTLDNTVKRVP